MTVATFVIDTFQRTSEPRNVKQRGTQGGLNPRDFHLLSLLWLMLKVQNTVKTCSHQRGISKDGSVLFHTELTRDFLFFPMNFIHACEQPPALPVTVRNVSLSYTVIAFSVCQRLKNRSRNRRSDEVLFYNSIEPTCPYIATCCRITPLKNRVPHCRDKLRKQNWLFRSVLVFLIISIEKQIPPLNCVYDVQHINPVVAHTFQLFYEMTDQQVDKRFDFFVGKKPRKNE